jgi:hypothetical protein
VAATRHNALALAGGALLFKLTKVSRNKRLDTLRCYVRQADPFK